jgi:hypothetical protein
MFAARMFSFQKVCKLPVAANEFGLVVVSRI